MKHKWTVLVVICLTGCVRTQSPFVVKNLDSWHRFDDFRLTHDVLVGADGYPIFGLVSNQVTSKWQIHLDAPIAMVARSTTGFRDMERIELWTSTGIFIVGAPNYGGRRLPPPGQTAVDYHIAPDFQVSRNKEVWDKARNGKDVAARIFADLARQKHLGFVNLYFEFVPTNTWRDAEAILNVVLPEIDDMRGFWLGCDENGQVTMHFHDIWKKDWKQKSESGKRE